MAMITTVDLNVKVNSLDHAKGTADCAFSSNASSHKGLGNIEFSAGVTAKVNLTLIRDDDGPYVEFDTIKGAIWIGPFGKKCPINNEITDPPFRILHSDASSIVLLNLNSEASDYRYQLNFVASGRPYYFDPRIKNGGRDANNNRPIIYILAGIAILEFVALVALYFGSLSR